MVRSRISPVRWQPPRSPGLTGPFVPNHRLAALTRIPVPGVGPEDIAVDQQGRLFTGVEDGRIIRFDCQPAVVIAHTHGRPLGIEVDAAGQLIVCDAERGLLRISPDDGRVEVLVGEVDGRPLIVTNNASLATDGSIYFSQSSTKFTLDQLKGDLLEHGGNGRLMRRNPNGSIDVLLTGLQFANGVALAPDESFVLVAETGAYRVRRLWLTGPRTGIDEILVNNLPGFPDNITAGSEGRFWIAIPSERNPLLDRLLDAPGAFRRLLWALPDRLQPDASRIGLVLGIDDTGAVRTWLHGDGRAFHYVTGVREHDGMLYLGSLVESAVASIPVPAN